MKEPAIQARHPRACLHLGLLLQRQILGRPQPCKSPTRDSSQRTSTQGALQSLTSVFPGLACLGTQGHTTTLEEVKVNGQGPRQRKQPGRDSNPGLPSILPPCFLHPPPALGQQTPLRQPRLFLAVWLRGGITFSHRWHRAAENPWGSHYTEL